MYIAEKFGVYMQAYEEYANKEEYELLIDYFIMNPEHKLGLHELKKRGFITGSANINGKINELVRLADSYAGSQGMVEFNKDTIAWKPFERVGNHAASYIMVSGSKSERAIKYFSLPV